jgi:peptide/nickel transport system substrate-binding protein
MNTRSTASRRSLRTLGLLTAGALALAACSSSNGEASTVTSGPTAPATTATPDAPPADGGTEQATVRGDLVFGVTADVTTISPWLATKFHDVYDVLPQLYNSLVAFDADLNVVPALAESWDVSDDGLTYTFHLRTGVTFADGSDFDAADVVASYETIKNPDTAAAAAANLGGTASITATDPSTVTIVLAAPDAAFLSKLAPVTLSILPSDVDLTAVETTPNGTGPFVLGNWTPNQSMTLTANDNYWGGEPTLASVEFRVIPDNASIASAISSGNVQMAVFPDAVTAQTAGANTTVVATQQLSYSALMLNSIKEGSVVADVNVRLAIQCAIDRDAIVQTAALGEGAVTGPITSPAFRSDPAARPCPTQDVDRAKQYLTDAGYADGLTIKALAPTANIYPQGPAEATALQAQLAAVGITLELDTLDGTAYTDAWLSGTYDAMVARNGGQPDPDAMYTRYFPSTGNLNQVAGFNSPALDDLFAQGKSETDQSARVAIYDDISRLLEDNAVWIWLYTPNTYTVTAAGVSGFVTTPLGSLQGLWATTFAS